MTLYRHRESGEQIRPFPGDPYDRQLAQDPAFEVVPDELYPNLEAPEPDPLKAAKKAAKLAEKLAEKALAETATGGIIAGNGDPVKVLVGENGPETFEPVVPESPSTETPESVE